MKKRKLRAFVAACALTIGGAAHAKAFNDLFLFGDSYTDTGAYVPLTNGTTAGAYLGQLLGIPITTSRNPSPGRSGVNFAESGARIDVNNGRQPRSLTQQVGEFQAYVQSGNVTFDPSSSLFFLLGGLNDHTRATQAELGAATTAQVQALYNLGARYFEIALLPSLVPAFADSAANVNPEMRLLVPQLQSLFPNAVIVLSNWGGYYDDILRNPQNYGINDTTNACLVGTTVCATPNDHFYYYSAHPSDAAHRIVGARLFAEAQAIPEPMSAALLAIGFASVALVRRKRPGANRGVSASIPVAA